MLRTGQVPPALPEGWREELVFLLTRSVFPPAVCIDAVGITQQTLDKQIELTQDVALQNLINASMKSYFNRKLQIPDLLDVKHPKFIELQLKCFTSLLDTGDKALALTDDQLTELRNVRKQLLGDIKAADEAKSKQVEVIIAQETGELIEITEDTEENSISTVIPVDVVVERFQELSNKEESDKPESDSEQDSSPNDMGVSVSS